MEWRRRWLTGLLVIVGCQAPAMEEGIATVPISAGDGYSCAITGPPADAPAEVVCWGLDGIGQSSPPPGLFQQLEAGGGTSCALAGNGEATCWGARPEVPALVGRLTQVSSDGGRCCGISAEDRSIVCWGSLGDSHEHRPPDGSYIQVSVAYDHSCAVATDGSLECWGNGSSAVLTPPAGSFVQVSAGYFDTCALTTEGEVKCWGGISADPPADTTFVQISQAVYSTCGITSEQTLECWGPDEVADQAPSGEFAYVDCGYNHACAIRDDGSVECWGVDEYGETEPP